MALALISDYRVIYDNGRLIRAFICKYIWFKQQSCEQKTLVNQYEWISPRIFLCASFFSIIYYILYSPTGMMSSGGRRNPYFPLSLNSMAAKNIL